MYRVAVCEDEEVLRRELCRECEAVLREMKVEHTVTAYASAEELESALAAGETYSLLCLDIFGGEGKRLEEVLAPLVRATDREVGLGFTPLPDAVPRRRFEPVGEDDALFLLKGGLSPFGGGEPLLFPLLSHA